jgi:long-chain acyl-CoA synthetase
MPSISKLSADLAKPPPPGAPYGVPIIGSEKADRSAVYRHWQFRDGPLLDTLDPSIRTSHEMFESIGEYFHTLCSLRDIHWL